METQINVDATVVSVRPFQSGEYFDRSKGAFVEIGFLLKDALKVHGTGANAGRVAMSQCCYEQHFISIFANEINDLNRLKEEVYQALTTMDMDEQLAQGAKTSVATAIKNTFTSSRQISRLVYCAVKMEVVVDFVATKRRGPAGKPSGEHGAAALRQRIQNEECSICQEDCSSVKDIVVTPCHHVFHNSCIFDWLNRGRHTCPMCRSDLGPMIGRPMTFE